MINGRVINSSREVSKKTGKNYVKATLTNFSDNVDHYYDLLVFNEDNFSYVEELKRDDLVQVFGDGELRAFVNKDTPIPRMKVIVRSIDKI